MQSNVVDKALRDYDATVNENMLMTNSIGALLVFVCGCSSERTGCVRSSLEIGFI